MNARCPFLSYVLVLLVSFVVACGGGNAGTTSKPAAPLVVGKGSTAPTVPPPASVPEDELAVPIAPDDAVIGDRGAFVTLVVFSDFQCPFCGRLAPEFARLREEYGDANVRIVFKNNPLPFHQHARVAAEIGQGVVATAGQEAFWRFHDIVFKDQRQMSPEGLKAMAREAGADPRALASGLDARTWAAKVDRDVALAKKLGANGTPVTFVNGVEVSGAQPHDKWKEIVEAELKRARELRAQGVAADRVYARAVGDNYKEPKARPDTPVDPPPDTTVWKIPVTGSPVRGSATAAVTIVMFGDFQCPFCRRVVPELERLRAEYGDRVRIVWKDAVLPFHPRGGPAAELARAARAQKGDAGFWSVHDKLFASAALEDADLERVAKAAQLDAARAMASVRSHAFKKSIDADGDLAEDVQASGTPHFFVNGRRFVGAQPYDKFKAMVEEELVKTDALVKAGTPKAGLYDAIMKTAKGPAEPERKTVAAPAGAAAFAGSANAKVTIYQFSDFQCPFCKRVEPTIADLLKAYPGKIKVVWRDMPLAFHPDAPLAAEAAREAFAQKGNEGFAKMRTELFDHQADVDGLKRQALEGYAQKIGLDLGKFGKALDDHRHQAAVLADKQAAESAGINGTPAFVIGPFFLSGAQTTRRFSRVVERALAEPAAPAAPPTAKPVTR